jgi:hypothetical protein
MTRILLGVALDARTKRRSSGTSARTPNFADRRPIGAGIADICRDLGITPSHRGARMAWLAHG